MFAKTLLLLSASLSLQAATIVSVDGPVSFGGSVGINQAITAGFSTSQLYSNVEISALISGPATDPYTAYLTTSIGPATTVANQAAVITQNFPGFNPPTLTPIFTGLNLAADTYYLTIFNSATTSGGWSSTNMPTIVTAAGAAHVFSGYFITNNNLLPYPPAASYADLQLQGRTIIYSVATSEIPEPATVYLGGIALLSVALLRYRGCISTIGPASPLRQQRRHHRHQPGKYNCPGRTRPSFVETGLPVCRRHGKTNYPQRKKDHHTRANAVKAPSGKSRVSSKFPAA